MDIRQRVKHYTMDIRDPKYVYSLFVSEIQHAQSEVLIAVNSILYLEYLAETGLVDSLKQAQSNGVNVMILYSEEGQNCSCYERFFSRDTKYLATVVVFLLFVPKVSSIS
jgi:hypothetical protein